MSKTKFFIVFVVCLSLIIISQDAQAQTDAEKLQPATPGEATKIGDLGSYIDEYSSYMQLTTALHSSETMHLPDVHIGGQGVGGVTFFNGTIVNETTNPETGAPMSVTFGDNVRVDGYLHGGPSLGYSDDNVALKIGDNVYPGIDNKNDFGKATHRWRDAHFSGTVWVGNLGGGNVVHENNLSVTNSPTENYVLSYAGNNRFAWTSNTLNALSCSDGQIAVYDSATTSWTCGNQTTDTNTDTLSNLSCSDGQIAVYDSATTSWTCGNQTTDTDTLSGLSCNDGEIISYDSGTASWVCTNLCTLYNEQCAIN